MAATQQDSAGTSTRRALRVGVLGIGVSGARVARAMSTMPETELVAAGDTRERVQHDFNERYGTPVYGSAEELCADPNVEALWISTPNQFHAEHTILAAQHGKHIIIEKPIAISMAEAERMLDAVEANGVTMVCGHTQSYTPRARKVLAILRSGELGRLCAMNVWAYTDWMLRPRTAVDLDPDQGGGIPYRQAPHQVDTLRILGGGMVRSVRGMTGQWMPERTIPGYYSAYMEFEDGTPVTLLHNGYGFFNTAELAPWESERSGATPESRGAIRKGLRSGTWDEEAAKQERYLGGRRETEEADREGGERPWVPDDLGMLVVSCERGDIRYSPHGLFVYDEDGRREEPVTSRNITGHAELTELYNAVVLGQPVSHSGQWGAATLEVCLAIMESARERKEVYLRHQVPTPEHYV